MAPEAAVRERPAESAVDERYAVDEQTGEVYKLRREGPRDQVAAILSGLYLVAMMIFFFWLLFDVWIGQYSLANLLGYKQIARLASPAFRLPAYCMIGGALGGIVNGIRSFLVWHAERFAFGERFTWKYATAPWLGGALALFTYALVRSGVTVFSGDASPDAATVSQVLAMFGVGVLAGYGSHNAFVWLDAQVSRIFQVQPTTLVVPALTGQTQAQAEDILGAAKLKLGEVKEEATTDPTQSGVVIRQTPPPGSSVASGVSVNITVGKGTPPEPASDPAGNDANGAARPQG